MNRLAEDRLHGEWSRVKLNCFLPGIPALLPESVSHRSDLFSQHQKLHGCERQSNIAARQMNTAGRTAEAATEWSFGGMLFVH